MKLYYFALLVHYAYGSPMLTQEAPLYSTSRAQVLPDQFIVMLKPHVNVMMHTAWLTQFLSMDATATTSNSMDHVYPLWNGYTGQFDAKTVRHLRSHPDVDYIERDQQVHLYDKEEKAPWGLSRISHRDLSPDHVTHDYEYRPEAGSNVTVYVIDTGIHIQHHDFEGRAEWGVTIPKNDADKDGNGHGTHVAGTICGKQFGVAKKARAVAVKVLRSNGSGTMSDVLKGIEWVLLKHRTDTSRGQRVKSVANMSLGGGKSRALDKAVNQCVEEGIAFAVAAGNDGLDACDYSPAAADKAVTVGATTSTDSVAWFSNHGDCTDVFAPGHEIESTWIGSNQATNIISGTSMASPHVAGILAVMQSLPEYEDKSPLELKKILIETSSKNILKEMPTWAGGSNRLVYLDSKQPSHEEKPMRLSRPVWIWFQEL